jgi:hypothetical protein
MLTLIRNCGAAAKAEKKKSRRQFYRQLWALRYLIVLIAVLIALPWLFELLARF